MSQHKTAAKRSEKPEVSDREILGALISAIQVLAEKLTGHEFIIKLKTNDGRTVRLGTRRTRAYFKLADSEPQIVDGPPVPKSRGVLKRPRR